MGAVSVCSGDNVVRDVCEEQIKSAIDCALSQVVQTTRPIEEREKKWGIHILTSHRKCTYVDGNKVRAL